MDDLLNDVIQYDQKFDAGYCHDGVFGQGKVAATFRDGRWLVGIWRIFGAFDFLVQIDGFKMGSIFMIPSFALPSMQFSLAIRFAAGLLSSDLTGIGRKPPATNRAWSLSRLGSWHQIPLHSVFVGHDTIKNYLDGCLGFGISEACY